jgi:hypothetical protein
LFQKIHLIITLLILCSVTLSSAENAIYTNIISPENNALLINGKQTTVTFEFDKEAANKENAWLVVKFDSQVRRTIVGTSIESPLSYKASAKDMTVGNHLIEFILLRSQSGNDEILAIAEMTLHVENPGEKSENLIYSEVTSHSSTDVFTPGEDISLVFEFDEEAANTTHSKIIFMFDERTGEIASPLVSPFIFDIPGRMMTMGEHYQRFIIMENVAGKDSILAYSEIELFVAEPDNIVENAFDAIITTPSTETLFITGNEAIVTVEFDEESANDRNAWLVVMFDEKNASTVFGTSINSPYTLDIPGKIMTKGEHLVKFLFMDKVNGIEKVISSTEVVLKVTD